MDELANFKKIQVNNYFSSIYDLSEGNIDINQIKHDLHQLIGEVPGVELNYQNEMLITEDSTEPVRHERLNSISIYYTYEINIGNGQQPIPRFEKVTYII